MHTIHKWNSNLNDKSYTQILPINLNGEKIFVDRSLSIGIHKMPSEVMDKNI